MKSSLITALGGATTALAAVKGFNYAAQEGAQAKFESDFTTAAGLEGTDGGFTSARLYTMIQEGTTNSPIEAIPAAIDTQTTLLLGLWCSSDQSTFDNEITALENAIQQYGSDFADLVVGISVGSEDLYRISETGIENESGIGQTPSVLVDYIGQVRKTIEGTSLSSKPVGHVDTWNAFINGSNSAVIDACDFLGLDEYPYFQTTDANGIDNGKDLFFEAFDKVQAVAPGKQIFVTEAGWPVSGPESGDATASADNAETFWKDVACELESRGIDFWWYMLEDTGASPSFGVSQSGQPLYDLSCSGVTSNSTSNSTTGNSNSTSSSNSTSTGKSSATATASGLGTSATATGSSTNPSGSGSGSASGSAAGPSSSTFAGAAGKVEAGVAGLLVAAFAAALL